MAAPPPRERQRRGRRGAAADPRGSPPRRRRRPTNRWLNRITATQSSTCSVRARTSLCVYDVCAHVATTGLPWPSRCTTPVYRVVAYVCGTESPTNAFAIRASSADRRSSAHDIASIEEERGPGVLPVERGLAQCRESARSRRTRGAARSGAAMNGLSTRFGACGRLRRVGARLRRTALRCPASGRASRQRREARSATSAARGANASRPAGGSVWESNPPNPTSSGRISFED